MTYSLTGTISHPPVYVPPPTSSGGSTGTPTGYTLTPTYNDITTLSGRIYNNYTYQNIINDSQYLTNLSLSGRIYVLEVKSSGSSGGGGGGPPPTNTTPTYTDIFTLSGRIYNIQKSNFFVGSVNSLPYGSTPSVNITNDISNNNVLNFQLITGPQGPQGPTGNLSNQSALDGFLSTLTSVGTTVASDVILAQLGLSLGAQIATLSTQVYFLDLQVYKLGMDIAGLELQMKEVQLQNEAMATQIEQLSAQVSNISCIGPYSTNINSPISVYNPFSNSTFAGDVKIYGTLYTSNLASSTGFSQF